MRFARTLRPLAAGLTLASAGVAHAQAAPASAPAASPRPRAPEPDDSDDTPEIVVRGQKPRGSVVGDIPPEQSLAPADIRAYGVSSVTELLDELAPQTTSVRGRGGEAPAVLLNGRRISSFAEIRDLPTEAIERVDILPEEVALKYGYSADQKVVNFVLRRRFRAITAEATGGATTRPDAPSGTAEGGLFRIRGDQRFNVDLKYQQSADLLESARGLDTPLSDTDPTNVSGFRTLRPETHEGSANVVLTRPFLFGTMATVIGSLDVTRTDALQGVLDIGSPIPLNQDTDALTGHLGLTLARDLAKWRFSFTANYDHGDTRTRTLADVIDAGTGRPFRDRARALSDTGNVQLVANGSLFKLPAGDVSTTLKGGFEDQSFRARSLREAFPQASQVTRGNLNGQVNVDVPLTSRRNHVLSAIGDLSINGNVAVRRLSDFGTLTTTGYGATWKPRDMLSLIVSVTDDQGAPTVQQLGNPVILTPDVLAFDYVLGRTVSTTQIGGGNPALKHDDRHVLKLGLTLKPFTNPDVNFTANYVQSRIRNAIASFPEPTLAIQQAFPDRFVRDEDGDLDSIDTRPVNFARENRNEMRWGFNVSKALKPSPKAVAAFRQMFQEERARRQALAAARGEKPGAQGRQGAAGPPQGEGPPPGAPPPGDGPPPGGFGGPGGGGPGGGGFGGPGGGGPGGGPGGGGGGFRGNGGRSQAGGRLMLSVYHTWVFRDDVLIRPGLPVLDLLNGDAIASTGGQPRHQVEAQLGYSNNGFGARLTANWQSGTRVDDPTDPAGDLRFSTLSTVGFRLFANVGQIPSMIRKPWARGLRVTFSASNLFDTHERVRRPDGTTPLRYDPAFLDPLGRTFRIGIRKLFI